MEKERNIYLNKFFMWLLGFLCGYAITGGFDFLLR